jgi:hypothetical protein
MRPVDIVMQAMGRPPLGYAGHYEMDPLTRMVTVVAHNWQGEKRTMDMRADAFLPGLADWQARRKLIQNAFPGLTADQREFLQSGMLPEEFDRLRDDDEDG